MMGMSVLDGIKERGIMHITDVAFHLSCSANRNFWCGTSSADFFSSQTREIENDL
jgi:hypothetical protein